TPANRRARQREAPPNILLTTPESLAVLLSLPDAPSMFAGLAGVGIDEGDALGGTKRGEQLGLGGSPVGAVGPGGRRGGAAGGGGVPGGRAGGDGGASGGDPRLCRRRTADRGAGWRTAGTRHDVAGGRVVLGRPYGVGGSAQGDGAHPGRRHDDRIRQHARPGG